MKSNKNNSNVTKAYRLLTSYVTRDTEYKADLWRNENEDDVCCWRSISFSKDFIFKKTMKEAYLWSLRMTNCVTIRFRTRWIYWCVKGCPFSCSRDDVQKMGIKAKREILNVHCLPDNIHVQQYMIRKDIRLESKVLALAWSRDSLSLLRNRTKR